KAASDDLTKIESDDLVCERRQKRHIVLDDEQARAGEIANLAQQGAEGFGLSLRDPRRRFVEEDDLRFMREDAREVDHAPRPRRDLLDDLVAERPEADPPDGLL